MSFSRHALVLFLAMNSFNAFAEKKEDCSKNAFSLGLKTGLSLLKTTRSDDALENRDTGINDGENLARRSKNNKGRSVGIFGSYLHQINKMGFGFDLFWEYGPVEDTIKKTFNKNTDITFEIKQKLKAHYGILLKGGYFVRDDVFLYGVAGYSRRGVEYIQHHSRVDEGAGDGTSVSRLEKVRKHLGCFTWGIGVDKKITPSFSLGLEGTVSHTPKKNIYFSRPPAAAQSDSSMPTTSRFKNIFYTANVKIAYTF